MLILYPGNSTLIYPAKMHIYSHQKTDVIDLNISALLGPTNWKELKNLSTVQWMKCDKSIQWNIIAMKISFNYKE